jgi:hypothetical protein
LQKLRDSISNWRIVAEGFEGNLIADSGRFETEQLALPPDINSFQKPSPHLSRAKPTQAFHSYIY